MIDMNGLQTRGTFNPCIKEGTLSRIIHPEEAVVKAIRYRLMQLNLRLTPVNGQFDVRLTFGDQ